MQNNEPSKTVKIFFTHEFKRNLRQLAKKYRRIQEDIQPILSELQNGSLPGEQIPGVTVEVYKVRARNSDSTKGKSGGYRIVYQKKTSDEIVLVTLYSKTEQEDIAVGELQVFIREYEQEVVEEKALDDGTKASLQAGDKQEQKDTSKHGTEASGKEDEH